MNGHEDIGSVDHHGHHGEKDRIKDGLLPWFQDVYARDEEILIVQPAHVFSHAFYIHASGFVLPRCFLALDSMMIKKRKPLRRRGDKQGRKRGDKQDINGSFKALGSLNVYIVQLCKCVSVSAWNMCSVLEKRKSEREKTEMCDSHRQLKVYLPICSNAL